MSHSSSQTEIGSIHSQKSQQRELSCPVSWSPITILTNLSDIPFQPPSLLLDVCLLINHWRGSSSKHCYVKDPPRVRFWSVSKSSRLAAVQGSPKRAWYCRRDILSMSAMQQQMADLQSLPSSPRQPSHIYRDWHWTTSPPPSAQTQTHTQTFTNMLPSSGRRLDGAISEALLGDLWPVGNNKGRVWTGRDMLSVTAGEGL